MVSSEPVPGTSQCDSNGEASPEPAANERDGCKDLGLGVQHAHLKMPVVLPEDRSESD